jgi:xanthine/uracil permease
VLLGGLAAGALWCLLSLFTERDTSLALVVFAVLIALFLRWQGFVNRNGAIGAVVATIIAFVYAQYLFSAVHMAEMLGFPLRDTLFKMDLPFAWRVAKSTLGVWDFANLLLACAVAARATAYKKT